MPSSRPSPHPAVYALLYYPFGAFSGFITVAMTFLATRHGLEITEGALFTGVSMGLSWLKWTWAPLVDVTLSPKRWYHIATVFSALSVLALAVFPISRENLPLLLGIVAVGTLVNSIVGMAIEAIMGFTTPPEEAGRVGGWFQVGNLGGSGVGGGLGLVMLDNLPEPWMAGAIIGGSFLLCGVGLHWLPDPPPHPGMGVGEAVRKVGRDILDLGRSRGGLLAAIVCFLPLGTGASAGVLTQSEVAGLWGAGASEVAWVQGWLSAVFTPLGCLAGGYVCQRYHPRSAYAGLGLLLAAIGAGMALSPRTVYMYEFWSVAYSFGLGLCFAAFTATVLNAMGSGSAATKYNLYASLSNFPIWWLGLLLAWITQRFGVTTMLYAEAGFAVLGVGLFILANQVVARSSLPARPGV